MSREAAVITNTIARIAGLTAVTKLGGSNRFRHAEQTPDAQELQSGQLPDRRFVVTPTGDGEFTPDAPAGPLTTWTWLDVPLDLAVVYTVQRDFTATGAVALEDQAAILYALTRADQYDSDNTGIVMRTVRPGAWVYPRQIGGKLIASYQITITYQPAVTD